SIALAIHSLEGFLSRSLSARLITLQLKNRDLEIDPTEEVGNRDLEIDPTKEAGNRDLEIDPTKGWCAVGTLLLRVTGNEPRFHIECVSYFC
ncbi:MAG: hypothetical protein OXI86_05530, partial [Candidatus Poribacteria bacterium]|nr:hypothetical protein [Candidatus Poribacteria bacterium]